MLGWIEERSHYIGLVAPGGSDRPNDDHPPLGGRSHQEVIYVHLFFRSEKGQGLAEYALILALIAIVAIAALLFLGGGISKILSTVGESV